MGIGREMTELAGSRGNIFLMFLMMQKEALHVGLIRKIEYGLLLISLVLIAGCGGSPPPVTPPHDVTLKLSVKGTPSADLAGFGITLVLPSGLTTIVLPGGVIQDEPGSVTPDLNSNGSVLLTVSGGVVSEYIPATSSVSGTLNIAAAYGPGAVFVPGVFATVALKSPSGNFHLLGDYSLKDFRPVDAFGYPVTGLTASYEIF